MTCPRCGGSDRNQIGVSYYQCVTVESQLMPAPPGSGVEMVSVDVMCGETYQEGAPPTSQSPLCSCGTYAIGKCRDCEDSVCGLHSSMRGGARLCGTCSYQREFKAAAVKAQAEESARVKEAEERASWPPQSHADRVAEFAVYALTEPQKTTAIEVDGAEIASVLLEAGVEPRPYIRPKKFLRSELEVSGWEISEVDHDRDSRGYDMERFILATDGTQWRHRGSQSVLEQIAGRDKIYPAHTLRSIYQGTDTYHQRLRNHMHEQTLRLAEQSRHRRNDFHRQLLDEQID